MATFTATISESIKVYGGEPTNRWGAFEWGQKWAFGDEDLIVTVFTADGDTITIADNWSLVAQFFLTLTDSMTVGGTMTDENIKDASGYNRVFTKPSIDAEDRSLTEFGEVAGPSNNFSAVTGPTSTWNEV